MAELLSLEISGVSSLTKTRGRDMSHNFFVITFLISHKTQTPTQVGFVLVAEGQALHSQKTFLGLIKEFQMSTLGPSKSSKEVNFSPIQKKKS